MPVFENQEQLATVMQNLWKRISEDKKMSDKLLESKLIVRFIYKDPDGILTIDGSSGKELGIHFGPCDIKPTLEMEMKSEFAHKFWMGKENPAAALLAGKIVSRGPVNKALALLPTIKPAFNIYPLVLEEARKAG